MVAHVSTCHLCCIAGEAGSASEPALADKKGSLSCSNYACNVLSFNRFVLRLIRHFVKRLSRYISYLSLLRLLLKIALSIVFPVLVVVLFSSA